MSMPTVVVGDTKTVITYTIRDEAGAIVDLSAATVMQVHIDRPGELAPLTRAAAHVTDGTDGQMSFESQAGDFGEAGSYQLQAEVGWSDGSSWRTDSSTIRCVRAL